MGGFLDRLELPEASVAAGASVAEAAAVLAESGLSAIAVVDGRGGVLGLFAEDELLRALFPRYLAELRHTSAAIDDAARLADRARQARTATVDGHVREAVTVEHDASMTHVAEVFLHAEAGAIAVVERGRFRGMLAQTAFCHSLLDELLL